MHGENLRDTAPRGQLLGVRGQVRSMLLSGPAKAAAGRFQTCQPFFVGVGGSSAEKTTLYLFVCVQYLFVLPQPRVNMRVGFLL